MWDISKILAGAAWMMFWVSSNIPAFPHFPNPQDPWDERSYIYPTWMVDFYRGNVGRYIAYHTWILWAIEIIDFDASERKGQDSLYAP